MSSQQSAFICHASEDKARFVEPLARRLRANGVDAWYDGWEILAGDSLWERIADGIDQSANFVFVASRASINKPWVRAEIGAGFTKKLKNNGRFIVVVLDQCADDLPSLLTSSRYVKIDDVHNYDAAFVELLNGLLSRNHRPSLGSTSGGEHQAEPLPRMASVAIAWRSASRLKEPLIASWFDGNYMWDAMEVIQLASEPIFHYILLEAEEFRPHLEEVIPLINRQLSIATRHSDRMRHSSVVIEILAIWVDVVELAARDRGDGFAIADRVVRVFAQINPQNSVAERAVQRDREAVIALAAGGNWKSSSNEVEQFLLGDRWPDGEPAYFNDSVSKKPSIWKLFF